MHPINRQQMANLRKAGLRVQIRHDHNGGYTIGFINGNAIQASSSCIIANEDDAVLASGFAYCSINDQFSRDEGSSLAFRRAISKLPLTRAQRTELLAV